MRFGWGILGILCCGLRESDFSLIDFFNRESDFFSMRKRIIFLRESEFFSHPSWLRKKNRLVVNAFAPLTPHLHLNPNQPLFYTSLVYDQFCSVRTWNGDIVVGRLSSSSSFVDITSIRTV